MPSTRLADCANPLAVAWVDILGEYRATHPGCDLLITCTRRSAEEQWELFKQGRVLKDGVWVEDADPRTGIVTQIDGKTKQSKHNSNLAAAIDACVLIQGKASWKVGDYLDYGRLAQACGLVWGGTWGGPVETVWERIKKKQFVDAPHIELREG